MQKETNPNTPFISIFTAAVLLLGAAQLFASSSPTFGLFAILFCLTLIHQTAGLSSTLLILGLSASKALGTNLTIPLGISAYAGLSLALLMKNSAKPRVKDIIALISQSPHALLALIVVSASLTRLIAMQGVIRMLSEDSYSPGRFLVEFLAQGWTSGNPDLFTDAQRCMSVFASFFGTIVILKFLKGGLRLNLLIPIFVGLAIALVYDTMLGKFDRSSFPLWAALFLLGGFWFRGIGIVGQCLLFLVSLAFSLQSVASLREGHFILDAILNPQSFMIHPTLALNLFTLSAVVIAWAFSFAKRRVGPLVFFLLSEAAGLALVFTPAFWASPLLFFISVLAYQSHKRFEGILGFKMLLGPSALGYAFALVILAIGSPITPASLAWQHPDLVLRAKAPEPKECLVKTLSTISRKGIPLSVTFNEGCHDTPLQFDLKLPNNSAEVICLCHTSSCEKSEYLTIIPQAISIPGLSNKLNNNDSLALSGFLDNGSDQRIHFDADGLAKAQCDQVLQF